MDQRLNSVYGHRPHRLTQNEVPELARGLLAFVRGQAKVARVAVNNIGCFRIFSNPAGVDLIARTEDWSKLVPYLKDGTFDTLLLPVAETHVLRPNSHFDSSVLDVNDRELYLRILTLLNQLFPIEFPTTNL